MTTPVSQKRKRIAWLTPFGPRSDIGAHSAAVTRAIHARAADYDCEVTLIVEPNGATYRTPAPRLMMGPQFDPAVLSLFDLLTLNIGNNQENHGRINEIALTRGGVVVLHDLVMQHYLVWKILGQLGLDNRYVDLMARYYGAGALEIIHRSGATLRDRPTRYEPWQSEYAVTMPLIEPFLDKASAVVVHSRFAAEIVTGLTRAPVLSLFLPSDKKPPPEEYVAAPDGRVRFCALGHVTRSKLLHLSLDAFAASPALRAGASLRIAGGAADSDYVRELMDIVREEDLQDVVKFEFDISETRLAEIKAATDAFVNLRFPHTESASGSLAEQMACGLPTIVVNSGCYQEIPDAAVYKIGDVSSANELVDAMESLARDSLQRLRIGKAAREFGRNRTADDYARGFLEFVASHDLGADASVGRAPSRFAELAAGVTAAATVPDLFKPENRPTFATLAPLNPATIALYLSVGVLCTSFDDVAKESATEIVKRTPASRLPRLIGALSFLNRLAQGGVAPILAELDYALDPDALAIFSYADPRKFAQLIYLIVLARLPNDDELHLAAAAPINAPRGELIRRLVETREYDKRSLPRSVAESIEALTARLEVALSPPPSRWPVLPADEAQARRALTYILAEGWFPLEDDGAWSRELTAQLKFRLAPASRLAMQALELDLRALKPRGRLTQSLHLALNGEAITEVPIDGEQRFQLLIPLEDLPDNALALTLTVERLVRPGETETGGDPRALGVFLYGLRLVGN